MNHFASLENNMGLILLEIGELQYVSFSDQRQVRSTEGQFWKEGYIPNFPEVNQFEK